MARASVSGFAVQPSNAATPNVQRLRTRVTCNCPTPNITEPWTDSINTVTGTVHANVTADTDQTARQRQPGQIVLNLVQFAFAIAVGQLGSLQKLPADIQVHGKLQLRVPQPIVAPKSSASFSESGCFCAVAL